MTPRAPAVDGTTSLTDAGSRRPAVAGRRYGLEHALTLGLPLGLAGARAGDRLVGRDVGIAVREVALPKVGEHLPAMRAEFSREATSDAGGARRGWPSPGVVELWTGLLAMFNAAGRPPDGGLVASKRALLEAAGWATAGLPPKTTRYHDLKAGLAHLRDSRYHGVEKSLWIPSALDYEQVESPFSLVHAFHLGEEPAGRRPRRGAPGATDGRSWVQLAPQVTELLRGGGRHLVRVDLDRFGQLGSDLARALFRVLLALRASGRDSIGMEALLARVGLVGTRSGEKARAQRLLAPALAELVDAQVLAAAPAWVRVSVTDVRAAEEWWHLHVMFGREAVRAPWQEALAREARELGVWANRVAQLLDHPVRLRHVLYAVKSGAAVPNNRGAFIAHAVLDPKGDVDLREWPAPPPAYLPIGADPVVVWEPTHPEADAIEYAGTAREKEASRGALLAEEAAARGEELTALRGEARDRLRGRGIEEVPDWMVDREVKAILAASPRG